MANAVRTRRDWSDWLNPVLVKELRQYFHNYGILAVMGVMLVVQLLLLVVMQYQVSESKDEFIGSGAVMFGMVAAGMALAAFLVCAVGSLLRFTAERRDRELDFSFISTISPNRIIWGKLLGAFVMTVFVYALCLPFMVIAYFLRGIAMSDMLLAALAILPAVLIAAQLGILVGSAGKRWLIGAYFLGMSVFGIFCLVFFAAFSAMFVSQSGSTAALVLLWYVVCAILLGLFYALSVAAVSSRQANRMLPVRIFLLCALAVMPLLGGGIAWMSDGRLGLVQGMLFTFVVGGAFIAGICATLAAFERHDPGERVRRGWPRNPAGRFACFLVSSGAWGGVALAMLIVLGMAGASAGLYTMDPDAGRAGLLWCSVACYLLFYANIAVWASVHWKALPGWCFWAFGMILFVFVPLLFCGLVAVVSNVNLELLLITTPFCLVNYAPGGEIMACFGPLFALFSLILAISARMMRSHRMKGGRV